MKSVIRMAKEAVKKVAKKVAKKTASVPLEQTTAVTSDAVVSCTNCMGNGRTCTVCGFVKGSLLTTEDVV